MYSFLKFLSCCIQSRYPLKFNRRFLSCRNVWQSMWDLWCTKWHWEIFFPITSVSSHASVSFHLCSIHLFIYHPCYIISAVDIVVKQTTSLSFTPCFNCQTQRTQIDRDMEIVTDDNITWLIHLKYLIFAN